MEARFWVCVFGFALNVFLFFTSPEREWQQLALLSMACWAIGALCSYLVAEREEE